jgi:hypothetical protein
MVENIEVCRPHARWRERVLTGGGIATTTEAL